ncbi:MAG: Gfo/Idh/MocA family oxidoreductase [Planctomycetes bacterium]|nr:Gfo/Idh/MocA family oxidoreductase [Planctomycetota bacterium]
MAKAKKPVGIGLVGLGFMGLTHWRASRKIRGGRLVAVADSDPRRARGDFSQVKGNFGAGGKREDLTGIASYTSMGDLLADDKVDLVDICLPTHLHAAAVVQALRAGKSVLVEKPIALNVKDARRMIEAGRRSGKLLMVAQVLKFFPEFAAIREAVQKNRWGRLLAYHARRIIAVPDWTSTGWFSDPKLSGGMVVDLHIHDTDFIVNLLGKPRAVTSSALVNSGQVDFLRTIYNFESGGTLASAEAGWINVPSLAFEHGYDAYFERATVRFNSTTGPLPKIFTNRSVQELRLPGGDGFQKEIQAAVDSVRTGAVHPLLSADAAAASLEICLAEQKSALTGKTVRVG